MKWALREFLIIIFVSALMILATNLYYSNNYIVYKIGEKTEKNILGEVSSFSKEDAEAIKKIETAYVDLKENYVHGIKSEDLATGAIQGMTNKTGDKYTSYEPAKNGGIKASEELKTQYYGIGVQLSIEGGYPTIKKVFENSPAAEEKLEIGDKIIQVGKEKYKDQRLDDFVDKIKGGKGTKVTLIIKRGEEEFTKKVERREVKMQKVNYEMKENGVAYINLEMFADTTGEEFAKDLKKLEKEKFKKLVLDLRGNSGGYVDQAVIIASQFLKNDKVIVKFEDKKGAEIKYYSQGKKDKKYPIEILIDGGSASASEILALALKENLENVKIIGEESYGKGVAQSLFMMDDGSELKITTSKWKSPKNVWLEVGKGIKPDKEIKNSILYGIAYIEYDSKKEINIGDKKEEIEYIETFLYENGYGIEKEEIDDKYNEKTMQAMKNFQAKNGLEQKGTFGKKEAEKMSEVILKNSQKKENDKQLEYVLKTN